MVKARFKKARPLRGGGPERSLYGGAEDRRISSQFYYMIPQKCVFVKIKSRQFFSLVTLDVTGLYLLLWFIVNSAVFFEHVFDISVSGSARVAFDQGFDFAHG